MKRITVLMAVLVVALASPASGQVAFGPQLSWADDYEMGIGVRGEVPLVRFITAESGSPASTMFLIGSFDWFFPDDGGIEGQEIDYMELNANVAYPLVVEGFRPYVGGGLNFIRESVELEGVSNSDIEVGLNVLGGLKLLLGTFDSFAEVRLELSGGEQLVITFGTLFGGE